jgi:hypothetical protein
MDDQAESSESNVLTALYVSTYFVSSLMQSSFKVSISFTVFSLQVSKYSLAALILSLALIFCSGFHEVESINISCNSCRF